MDDLISRAAAIAWFFRPYSNEEYYSNLDVEKALKAIPAVDAAPVIHGRWVYEHDDPVLMPCSVCAYQVYRYNNTPYCPYCGAKMKEDGGIKMLEFIVPFTDKAAAEKFDRYHGTNGELVRCRDCIYWKSDMLAHFWKPCDVVNTDKDWYCPCGKRR